MNEFKNLSEFQKMMHTESPDVSIISPNFQIIEKSLWSSSILINNERTVGGEGSYLFLVDSTKDFLTYSYLRCSTGTYRVKPQYVGTVEICLCRNYGYNMIGRASFGSKDVELDQIDPEVCEFYFGFNRKRGSGKKRSHERGIGNIRSLLNWTSVINDRVITFEQPFFYYYQTGGFPLIFFNNTVSFCHKYTMRKITDLMRMRIKKDGKWYDVEKSHISNHFSKYIECVKEPEMPQLWSKYSVVSQSEREFIRCHMLKEMELNGKYTYIYKRILDFSSPEGKRPKESTSCSLQAQDPIVTLFWAGLNEESDKFNNRSNFSIFPLGNLCGETATSRCTLQLLIGDKKFEDCPSEHFTDIEPRNNFPSVPDIPFLMAYAIGSRPMELDYDSGVIPDNHAYFSSTFKNIDTNVSFPVLKDDDDYGELKMNDVKYKLIVKAVALKKFSIVQTDIKNFASLQKIVF